MTRGYERTPSETLAHFLSCILLLDNTEKGKNLTSGEKRNEKTTISTEAPPSKNSTGRTGKTLETGSEDSFATTTCRYGRRVKSSLSTSRTDPKTKDRRDS